MTTQRNMPEEINGKPRQRLTRALLKMLAANADAAGLITISRAGLMRELDISERTLDVHLSSLYRAGLIARKLNEVGLWERRLSLTPAPPAPVDEPAAPSSAPTIEAQANKLTEAQKAWAEKKIKQAIIEIDELGDGYIKGTWVNECRDYIESAILERLPNAAFQVNAARSASDLPSLIITTNKNGFAVPIIPGRAAA